ncbi:hypothetical protein C8R47DRAFT_1075809 [Mycena vitilis]|nr:hypothetical protein C8R47DRAFT_1075809 [Mycena vitilis]
MSSQPKLILKLERDSSPFTPRSPQNLPLPLTPRSPQNLPMPLDDHESFATPLDGQDDHKSFLAELRVAEEELGLSGLANSTDSRHVKGRKPRGKDKAKGQSGEHRRMSSQPKLILKLERDSSPFTPRSPQNLPLPLTPRSPQNLPMPLDDHESFATPLDGQDDHKSFLAELRVAEEELGLSGLANSTDSRHVKGRKPRGKDKAKGQSGEHRRAEEDCPVNSVSEQRRDHGRSNAPRVGKDDFFKSRSESVHVQDKIPSGKLRMSRGRGPPYAGEGPRVSKPLERQRPILLALAIRAPTAQKIIGMAGLHFLRREARRMRRLTRPRKYTEPAHRCASEPNAGWGPAALRAAKKGAKRCWRLSVIERRRRQRAAATTTRIGNGQTTSGGDEQQPRRREQARPQWTDDPAAARTCAGAECTRRTQSAGAQRKDADRSAEGGRRRPGQTAARTTTTSAGADRSAEGGRRRSARAAPRTTTTSGRRAQRRGREAAINTSGGPDNDDKRAQSAAQRAGGGDQHERRPGQRQRGAAATRTGSKWRRDSARRAGGNRRNGGDNERRRQQQRQCSGGQQAATRFGADDEREGGDKTAAIRFGADDERAEGDKTVATTSVDANDNNVRRRRAQRRGREAVTAAPRTTGKRRRAGGRPIYADRERVAGSGEHANERRQRANSAGRRRSAREDVGRGKGSSSLLPSLLLLPSFLFSPAPVPPLLPAPPSLLLCPPRRPSSCAWCPPLVPPLVPAPVPPLSPAPRPSSFARPPPLLFRPPAVPPLPSPIQPRREWLHLLIENVACTFFILFHNNNFDLVRKKNDAPRIRTGCLTTGCDGAIQTFRIQRYHWARGSFGTEYGAARAKHDGPTLPPGVWQTLVLLLAAAAVLEPVAENRRIAVAADADVVKTVVLGDAEGGGSGKNRPALARGIGALKTLTAALIAVPAQTAEHPQSLGLVPNGLIASGQGSVKHGARLKRVSLDVDAGVVGAENRGASAPVRKWRGMRPIRSVGVIGNNEVLGLADVAAPVGAEGRGRGGDDVRGLPLQDGVGGSGAGSGEAAGSSGVGGGEVGVSLRRSTIVLSLGHQRRKLTSTPPLDLAVTSGATSKRRGGE